MLLEIIDQSGRAVPVSISRQACCDHVGDSSGPVAVVMAYDKRRGRLMGAVPGLTEDPATWALGEPTKGEVRAVVAAVGCRRPSLWATTLRGIIGMVRRGGRA